MVYVFLADGFETVEALAPVDVMRRAGIEVKTVSITSSRTIKSKQNITVEADTTIDGIDPESAETFVLPGGLPGADNLYGCEKLRQTLKDANRAGKYLAAICAAPYILGQLGLLEGKRAVCYPGFEDRLTGAVIGDKKVVTDGNVITAVGMGVSVQFGLAIVSALRGKEQADKTALGIQL